MSEDYTFLSNEQIKLMEDTLSSCRAYKAFLQCQIDTLEYELSVHKKALKLMARLLCDFEYCGEFSSDSAEFGCDCEACTCKIADEYLQIARKE